MKPRAWAKCDTCDQPGMWRKRGGGWSCSERRCPNESPAAPAPDAGPDLSAKVRLPDGCWVHHAYEGLCPDEEQPHARDPQCRACQALDAPRPDAAVDQHCEGECDCCDEWRRSLASHRARAEAAEREAERLRGCIKNVKDVWAEERKWRGVAEARAARMEAALREVRGHLDATGMGAGRMARIIDAALPLPEVPK